MEREEFFAIARRLECHYGLFQKFWEIGYPVITEKIPTAAVRFDKSGGTVDFMINPKFWATMNDTQRAFIVAHECLHVLYFHGLRITKLSKQDAMIANLCLDIVVNHTLVDGFGFSREEVDPENKLCWIDTVFQGRNDVLPGKSFEYYNALIREEIEKNPQLQQALDRMSSLDDHENLDSFCSKEFGEFLKDHVIPQMNDQHAESFKEIVDNLDKDTKAQMQQAGTDPGNFVKIIEKFRVIKKKKWETIIKKWAIAKDREITVEQWARKSRRMNTFQSGFLLPSDYDTEDPAKELIEVWFFADTSGSCEQYAARFLKAAASLPDERFIVRLFCFDTQIYETDLKTRKLYGFGGTSFSCIEQGVQAILKKENIKYPKAIFVITDGYGDHVSPEHADRWHWLLTAGGSETCIPKDSKRYQLKDFE